MTPAQQAALLAYLDKAGEEHSIRFAAASIAMHALLSGGHRSAMKPDVIAREAYECADAFLAETVSRLLPNGIR